MCFISIIIPLFNKESIIKNTINSVLSQSYEKYEIIVVNDGSTDHSLDIVSEIHDVRLSIINQDNGGPGKARNTGAEKAKGEWLLFLDADDELIQGALADYAQLAEQHSDADIIDCGQLILTEYGQEIMPHTLNGYSNNPLKDFYFRRISPGSNHSLFKKSISLQYPYNPAIRRFEDGELLLRMLPNARVFSTTQPMSLVHAEHSCASGVRKNINDDFIGHLSLKGSFWQKMLNYRFFIEERENYPSDCHRLYPTWYWRYDLLIVFKLLSLLNL